MDIEQEEQGSRSKSVPAALPKKTVKPRQTKKASAPPSSVSAPASTSVSTSTTGDGTTGHVLTQLERFANVPPSSPFHSSRPAVSEETPRAKAPLPRSRNSPSTVLPRETLNKSLTQGAAEARKVMEDLVINITGADPVVAGAETAVAGGKVVEEDLQAKLTEEQKGMTLEELVRMEFQKRFEVMAREGEGMIGQWEEKTRQARRKIEGL